MAKGVEQTAQKDMYGSVSYVAIFGRYGVVEEQMATCMFAWLDRETLKHQRRLNRALGLHKINKQRKTKK